MTQIRRCPNCSGELPPDAPEGLCPKCLLRQGLQETLPTEEPAITSNSKPTIRYVGDYELESEIARGGMGVVFKARQRTLNRPVAVKMILAGQLANDLAVDRFHAEAEAAANLKHPNIVAIHEVGQHEGQHYYSMDFVAGQNLAEWAAGQPVAAKRAAELVRTIADAVHYAHQRGTLHRDLKPSNILIDADDVPHVTDFGLAKIAGDVRQLTCTGDVMGTPAYMPPEQAAGRHNQLGPHSDVYALGAILYELLTGQPPILAESPVAALVKVLEADPVAPRAVNPSIPRDLETICLKCLEKSPQRRYPSARELAEDLGRFLRCEPVHARPAGAIRKASNAIRRRPGMLAAAAALAVLGLASAVFYLAEENAFLRAQQVRPTLVRQPGPLLAALPRWRNGALALTCAAFFSLAWRPKPRGRNRDAVLSDPHAWNPTSGRPWRLAAASYGVAALCVSVILLAKWIEAFVWEGADRSLDTAAAVYCSGWVGFWLLAWAVRDYRRATYGRVSPTKDQRGEIENRLLEFGPVAAIKQFRSLVSDASFFEAKTFVDELQAEWRERNPGKLAAAEAKSRQLNWRLLALSAAAEAAAVAILWLTIPAVRPLAVGFAEGFPAGLLFAAAPRLKGATRRYVVLFVLASALTLVLYGIVEYHVGNTPSGGHSSGWLGGVLFGAALLISGFTPRRGDSWRSASS